MSLFQGFDPGDVITENLALYCYTLQPDPIVFEQSSLIRYELRNLTAISAI